MATEFEMPIVRQIEIHRPVVDNVLGAELLHEPPTAEQAEAVDQVFAEKQKQPDAAASLLILAQAGMMLHDIVQDTLAAPADEEDEEKAKPRKKHQPEE